ncbi:retrovirus-related pol polyprotein from transposon opus [Plakobranchus ocellatus]|uniref:Retrovirus-related pol polyprotein from transposon opus n=1 Tax=Plakobranchus ocellatus TaxID=259542 RepID=A0AAV3ZJ92_9GAST|nr:retrovirus-related pol polyprotein from transposon opus [Plakobranchus ocellatus]
MKQYPLPVHAMDEVDKEINFMLESGIISKSTSPYASPITVVMKKEGAIRLCLDFRKLNKITIFDAQPIPTLDELLGKMKGAKFFTKVNATLLKVTGKYQWMKIQKPIQLSRQPKA